MTLDEQEAYMETQLFLTTLLTVFVGVALSRLAIWGIEELVRRLRRRAVRKDLAEDRWMRGIDTRVINGK